MNFKLYQKFLANLYAMLNNHIDRIVNAVNTRYDLMECWDSYKAIYLQIGLEATSEISVSMVSEIKRLRNDFKILKSKILTEINRTLKLLDKQHESPFVERLRASYFVSFIFLFKKAQFSKKLTKILIFFALKKIKKLFLKNFLLGKIASDVLMIII
jgi:hypothetical protein